ncbi:MAG: ATP-dependent zinc metalloprotease FtsH [Lachnospiraceae bacterium]|nr:ATP-dependent zinc metalloprotease FtsH [Lachnospiraceae bacterium]
MENRNKKPDNEKNNLPQILFVFLIVGVVTIILMSFLNSYMTEKTTEQVSYSQFINDVNDGVISHVTIRSTRLEYVKNTDEALIKTTYYTPIVADRELVERLEDAGVEFIGEEVSSGSGIVDVLLYYILPLLLIWFLLGFFMRRMSGSGGPMGVGRSNAKVYVQKETGVTFQDVAGEDEAKESLMEIVDFLHDPHRYVEIGAKLPKGALLVGPPGTGKTLLAKAVAGEAKVPFFSLSGSDFVEMFVGVGASRVRDLFKQAQQNAPCIIFIDEIDAIGKSRDSRYGGGNDEREQTLNQLLAEMDGFDSSKGVLILGATNRPEILDKALLRPGRFDRRIIVDKPDLKGRIDILKVHAKDVKIDETVDLEAIALATSGAVGSDLANMINEAAINAVKHGRTLVNQKDLFEAVEVVLVGKEKKDRIMSLEERKIVSYHEVGHALISALEKDAEPVQKITIVPRTMGALGYVMQVPEEEKYLNTKTEIETMIVVAMAGRAAEEIVFHNVTTGASNDIEQATRYARTMITMYGMSEKFGMVALETVENQYLDGRRVLNCGAETEAEIDKEVMRINQAAYQKAKDILSANRDILDEIAAFLIEKETITGKEFMEILHACQAKRNGGAIEEQSAAQDANTVQAPTANEPLAKENIQDTSSKEIDWDTDLFGSSSENRGQNK